jgi:hypothetical protein
MDNGTANSNPLNQTCILLNNLMRNFFIFIFYKDEKTTCHFIHCINFFVLYGL